MLRLLCIFQNGWKTNTSAVTIHILSTSFLFSLHFQPHTVHLLLRQLCCLNNWPVVTHSINNTHHSLFFLTHNTLSLSQAHRERHTHLLWWINDCHRYQLMNQHWADHPPATNKPSCLIACTWTDYFGLNNSSLTVSIILIIILFISL